MDAAKKYSFYTPREERDYRLFPSEFENDTNIFLHGTAATNLETILAAGFRADPPLEAISFARNSGLALRYACDARSIESPQGCVLMVRVDDLGVPGIAKEAWGILRPRNERAAASHTWLLRRACLL